MASQVEMLRKELYEASGRNRNYHVKAEDVKDLLPDGRCRWLYRHQPHHSGGLQGWLLLQGEAGRRLGQCWRFTAGDESEAYMRTTQHAGIYKLNTICNDDPTSFLC